MAAGTRRDRAPNEIEAQWSEAVRETRDRAVHRVLVGRRVHELLAELDVALSLYSPHVIPESEPDVARFRAELRRVRGGTDIGCPIPIETATAAHTDRFAVAEVVEMIGDRVSKRRIEQAVGVSPGYASKAIEGELPSRTCDRCSCNDARVTAAVPVAASDRRVLERERLCVACYESALTE